MIHPTYETANKAFQKKEFFLLSRKEWLFRLFESSMRQSPMLSPEGTVRWRRSDDPVFLMKGRSSPLFLYFDHMGRVAGLVPCRNEGSTPGVTKVRLCT